MDAPGPAKLGDAEMRSVRRLLILLMFLSVAGLFTPPAPTFAGFDACAPKPVRRTFAQLAFRQESQSLAVPSDAPLRNYGVVWDKRLTRSEMPKSDSGWKWLRSRGVKSIVTFRMENDVDYAKYGFVRVLRIPISDNPPADPPSDQQAKEFLRFIQDPNNAPVHMHCEAGRDRTGMMAALARYSIDGWPMEKALEEAGSYRHGEDLPPKRVAWLYNWASKHKPGSYRVKPDEEGPSPSSVRGRP